MKILIDADACPVVNLTITIAMKFNTPVILICDTAHEIYRDNAETIIADKGADSSDYVLVSKVVSGDIVVTQDYGLASLCLAKKATVLHQDGWEYTNENIDALLWQRHEAKKFRNAGGRTKGPAKRTSNQNKSFENSLTSILQKQNNSRDIPREDLSQI